MNESGFENLPEFDNHKLVTFIYDEQTGLKGYIAIHRSNPGVPSLGATRLWGYETATDALRDALRLSRIMSYKSALAGLPYGGAKTALIANNEIRAHRAGAFRKYAQRINYLGGQFITGTDVGVTGKDIRIMETETPYVIGTRVNPADYTGVSVFNAIKMATKFAFGDSDLTGRSFAIQGLGKTGFSVLKRLAKAGGKILVSDINKQRLAEAKNEFPKIKAVHPKNIYSQKVDVFVPCAMSGILNNETVLKMKCRIVAGSANNQLADDSIGTLVKKLGILYAPDYASNAGGLIAVAHEMENKRIDKEKIISQICKVESTLEDIFKRSEKENRPTNEVANEIAEKRFNGEK